MDGDNWVIYRGNLGLQHILDIRRATAFGSAELDPNEHANRKPFRELLKNIRRMPAARCAMRRWIRWGRQFDERRWRNVSLRNTIARKSTVRLLERRQIASGRCG